MTSATSHETGAPPSKVHLSPRRIAFVLGMTLAFVVVAGIVSMASLQWGLPSFRPAQVLEALRGNVEGNLFLIRDLRLPRVLGALMTGSMLGLSGVIMQDSLRNVLAGPELLGVSMGASVVVAAIIIFGLPVQYSLIPVFALIAGVLAGLIVIVAIRLTDDAVRVLLIGAALTSFLGALVIAIVALTPSGEGMRVAAVFRFLSGSLSTFLWPEVRLLAAWAIPLIVVAVLVGRPLNLLQLGDELAEGLGLPVVRARALLFLVAIALVAPVVATTGPISFIALLAPHAARRVLRTSDSRQILIVAAALGACFVVFADLLARLAFKPVELPVGLWTAVVGGSILLVLLRRELRGEAR